MIAPWKLLQSYLTAGTFTFTAPDYYGNGLPYQIGVFIIGAGGSGGVAGQYYFNSGPYGTASGGAAGYTKVLLMNVTPGNTYTVVVGAGGAATVATVSGTQGVNYSGYAGASSSFNGNTALGGGAGTGVASTAGYGPAALGAIGGQCSSTTGGAGAAFPPVTAPSGGINLILGVNVIGINPFNLKRYLGAGAAAFAATGNLVTETVATLDDGLVSGAAAASSTGNVTASAATSPGSGGGAAAFGSSTMSSSVITSGKGADGAVLIYVRGL
jgi:hypothetical protein